MKSTNKSANGTSFHSTTIKTSVDKLTEVLGPPDNDTNDGKDKVNYEWIRQTDSGDVFTVYDYKEYRRLKSDETIEWHIGGFNSKVTETAKQEIMDDLKLLK